MRRTTVAIMAIAGLVATAGGAVAGPTPNGHNCAGLVVSSLAGPGFGSLVSAAAKEQSVDNFGFANCGQPPRRNP